MRELNILIIEDSIYAADIYVRQIKKAGFLVNYLNVNNCQSMVRQLQAKNWDLILSENSIPNFNAVKALEIRNVHQKDVPFYIISENITQEELDFVMLNGCNGFIAKDNCIALRQLVTNLHYE